MKLSLKRILKELKPTDNIDVPYSPPDFGRAETHPGPQTKVHPNRQQLIKQKVDQGSPEVHQTDKGLFHYQGGVLHRWDGPAVVPKGAKTRKLQGGTEMAEGGEYYLYGKRFPDFAAWYRAVEQSKTDPEIYKQMQRRQRMSGYKGPDTEV